MARGKQEQTGFGRRDKVTATRELRGVPEGTKGEVMAAAGVTWPRYWVRFDNGVWLGTIDERDLVRSGEWETYKVRRAEEAERAKEAAATKAASTDAGPAAAAVDGAPAASGEASRVPAHLLERSRAARARREAAAG